MLPPSKFHKEQGVDEFGADNERKMSLRELGGAAGVRNAALCVLFPDPLSMGPQKALETIGANLQKQYENWQPRVSVGCSWGAWALTAPGLELSLSLWAPAGLFWGVSKSIDVLERLGQIVVYT